jgi:hypothetical protein
MPVLDAKALKTDRKGLAFLRAVLTHRQTEKSAARKGEARPAKSPSAASENLNR